jgi:hypothetical protein
MSIARSTPLVRRPRLGARWILTAASSALVAVAAATCAVAASAADTAAQPIDHSGLPGGSPLVAVDGDGNATVVWMQSAKLLQPGSLWSNRNVAQSDAWSAERTPLTPAQRAYTGHDVAAAPGGDVFVLAKDEEGAVVHRYSAQSKSWDKEWVLDKGPARRYDARIAMDSRGNALAVWTRRDATPSGPRVALWGSFYRAAEGRWGASEVISAPADWASDPALAFDGKGDAMVAWTERKTTEAAGTSTTEAAIRVRRFSAGAWASDIALFASDTGAASAFPKPRLAVARDGAAILGWLHRSRLWAVRYLPQAGGAGAWGSPAEIDAGGAPGKGGLALAMDDRGNAMAVWSQQAAADTPGGVYASRWTGSTAGLSKPHHVGTGSGDAPLNDACLVMDAAGNAYVAWTEHGSGRRNRLYTNRHVPGSGWAEASALLRSETVTAADPAIAVGPNGAVVLAWLSTDNRTANIMAQRLRQGAR